MSFLMSRLCPFWIEGDLQGTVPRRAKGPRALIKVAPRKPPKNEAPPRSNQVFDSNAAAVFSKPLYTRLVPASTHFTSVHCPESAFQRRNKL